MGLDILSQSLPNRKGLVGAGDDSLSPPKRRRRVSAFIQTARRLRKRGMQAILS